MEFRAIRADLTVGPVPAKTGVDRTEMTITKQPFAACGSRRTSVRSGLDYRTAPICTIMAAAALQRGGGNK